MSKLGDDIRRALAKGNGGEQDESWSPAPGPHSAVVVDFDVRVQRATDTPIIELELELEDPGPDQGKRWGHPMWMSDEAAIERTTKALSAYGIPDGALAEMDDVEDIRRVLDQHAVGTHVHCTTKAKDQGDGVWTNDVKVAGQPPSDVTPPGQEAFDVGDQPKAGAAFAGRPPTPDDDDIPF